jgi:hypothetical protein
MDKFLSALPSEDDRDLALCLGHGAAYQKDQSVIVEYDAAYFNKCAGYEGQEIAEKINAGRVAIVNKHYGNGVALDIGIGSGEFIKRRQFTYGMDVNPAAIRWLLHRGLWADDVESFRAMTMWDVIEHVPTPADYFDRMRLGSYLFTSIPIFKDLRRIRESKHYRPNEHLLYFTELGFINWMKSHGFKLLDVQDFESKAGRDSILSFAFQKWITPS